MALVTLMAVRLFLFELTFKRGSQFYLHCFCRNEDYREYKRTTSALIPLPPFCYGCLPRPIKCLFCCECPFYDHLDEETQKITVTKDMEANGSAERVWFAFSID